MRNTDSILQDMASIIAIDGIHRGDELGHRGAIDRFDISALAYITAEWIGPLSYPAELFDDELAGIRLIESSPGAMTAIRAISAAPKRSSGRSRQSRSSWIWRI